MPGGWDLLGDQRGKGVVLALDFEAVGRAEACFSDLASLLDPPLEIWAAGQPPAPASGALTSSGYLDYWSGGLRESGREITAVLGFCAGGVFAAALAEQVARWQATPPAAVLVDPELPTAATLIKQLDNAMQGLAGMASEAELAQVRERAAELGAAEDLSRVGVALTSLYQEACGPAFARIGLKADYQADLVASFGALMSYLAAAADVRTAEGWASATTIVSAAPPGQPAGVGRQVRVDVAHGDLLRSPSVAQLISKLLK